MTKQTPRYITPASIQMGDTIRITTTVADIEYSRVGKVVKRDYENGVRVFTTEQGERLLEWHPEHKHPRVTLLKAGAPTGSQLEFDMETP